jgi:hypothetical protein
LKKINFKILRSFVLVSFLVGSPAAVVVAQSYEIGGGLGTAVYSGDIIRKIDANQSGFQGTLFGKRNFDNVWSLKVGVNLAKIMGSDNIRPIDEFARVRARDFSGRITELSAIMEFNFLDYVNHKSEFKFSPYSFFGMGYAFVNGEGITPYRSGSVIIPFGGGVKFLLNEQVTLGMELGFRASTSDDLDQLSGIINVDERYSGGLPNPVNMNFGNPNTKDWYYFLGLTVSYTLNKARCYTY